MVHGSLRSPSKSSEESKINIHFKLKVSRGKSILVAASTALIFTLPAAANGQDSPTANIHASDPSTVVEVNQDKTIMPEVSGESTTSFADSNTDENANEEDAIGELVTVAPGFASVDSNKSLHASDPSLATPNDYVGEMVVTTPVEGNQRPNGSPDVDDPSKVQGDDYLGEMIVIVPSQDSNALVAYDANSVAPDVADSVAEEDFVGEMVVIAPITPSSAPIDALQLSGYEYRGMVYLPLVNN